VQREGALRSLEQKPSTTTPPNTMIPKEVIDELKQSHPELWAQKRAVLTEQQTAQVILAQIEIDKANPPHLEQVSRVKSLIEVANLKHAQAETVRIAAQRSLVELGEHAQLIDIELVDSIGPDEKRKLLDEQHADLNRLLDECRDFSLQQAARITELEADLKAAQDALQKKKK
jgi:hypothetical protein